MFKDNHRTINAFAGIWLADDLTNHDAESAILSDKQPKQESRYTLMVLN